jgi:hypothetical protein
MIDDLKISWFRGYVGPEEELTQNAMALVGRTLTLTGSQP